MKAFVLAYLFLNLIVLPAAADVIYFKDGMKTICQEKAWEENDQIKCEYAGWVLTYPKNEVLRIVKTLSIKQVAPADKNRRFHQTIRKDNSTKKIGPPRTDEIAFYNPRRPFPYWTGKALKHKSYHEAIKTLAAEYGQSSQWIQENMGNSNDLNEIHQNLKNAD